MRADIGLLAPQALGPETRVGAGDLVYTGRMQFLLLGMALLAARGAAADAPRPATPEDAFRAEVADLAHSAADPFASDASVWTKAQSFFSNVPGTIIRVEPALRGWDFGREALGDGREVAVKELVETGQERLKDLDIRVPAPDSLRDAVAGATALHDARRLRLDPDGKMAAGQMGLYRYVQGQVESGLIEINQRVAEMAAVIGKNFAYATLAHESDHRLAHVQGRLSPEKVIAGEISAFTTQYDWLVQVDPYGERLPYARAALMNLIRRGRGGALAVDSLAYLDHLGEVRATGRDPRKIEELIKRLGYEDGHEHAGLQPPVRS